MKHLKILGLAAVAVGALMAFIGAGTASATVLCSTTVDPCPTPQKWLFGTVHDWSIPAGNSVSSVDTNGNTLNTCKTSTIKGKQTTVGSETETVTVDIEEKTWGSCTFPSKTLKNAAYEIHRIAGTSNGTVTADGTTETTFSSILGDCIYGVTSGTSLGDITEGNPAMLHLNAVTEEFSHLAACPDTDKVTGTYVLTAPAGTTLSVQSSGL